MPGPFTACAGKEGPQGVLLTLLKVYKASRPREQLVSVVLAELRKCWANAGHLGLIPSSDWQFRVLIKMGMRMIE